MHRIVSSDIAFHPLLKHCIEMYHSALHCHALRHAKLRFSHLMLFTTPEVHYLVKYYIALQYYVISPPSLLIHFFHFIHCITLGSRQIGSQANWHPNAYICIGYMLPTILSSICIPMNLCICISVFLN